MLRQLLTVLALLTGFSAVVEPVRALDAGVQSVQLAERQKAASAQVSAVAEIAGADIATPESTAPRTFDAPAPMVPAVLMRVDRAHE